jgi:hypothetical protein
MSDKKKRLFARSPGTDDMWALCGGPDASDAIRGLVNLLTSDVQWLMASEDTEYEINLQVRLMSDDEVAALPDI